jgi:phosphoglycerol transferase MdoB-like AlkP superfamily enzyme
MRDRLLVFFKLFVYWMMYMSGARILFLLYNYDLSASLSLTEKLTSLFYGLYMDMSMTGYAMALSGLLLTLSCLLQGRWIGWAISTTTILILAVNTVIVIIDIELYRHWGFRMNTTPLFYMGSEALGSVNGLVIAKVIAIGMVILFTFIYFYFKWIVPSIRSLGTAHKSSALVLLLTTASMFLCIRGSLTVAPMNTGFVYFHRTKMYANHAAINVIWNFFKSLSRTSHIEYPEDFFDQKSTDLYFNQLYPKQASTSKVLNTEKPDIILIIIESYTAGVIEPLGGVKGITPNFSRLSREGILFDNFYASGDRTDKGLISILSGYPAQPNSSIIKYPQKTQHLPFLTRKMKDLGYRTSFTYGGDADFANFRSYLMASGFDNLTEDEDFDSQLNTSKWGVHDGYLLQRALQEIDTAQSPYFKTILTQSSHEPFDVPMKPLLPPTSDENQFLNSCHYTDSCLGSFIDKLKTSANWEKLLIVITADHGHPQPHNKPLSVKERFHIPLLLLGGALQNDSTIHTVGSQTDIANTLLAQLGNQSPDFIFSKNILSPDVMPHAAYYYNDGYGFVLPNKWMVFDNTLKKFTDETNVSELEKDWSKAHQQKLFSDYNKR